MTTSVTSPGPRGEPAELEEREQKLVDERGHIQYVNLRERGYLLLDIESQRTRAEFWYVDNVLERGGGERLGATYITKQGTNHLARDGV